MLLSSFARKTVICWCLGLASPAVVFGQTDFTPFAGEYSIVGSLPGDQVHPGAAIDANGGYLVWQDNSVNTNGLRIQAARLNSNFTTLSNIVVSAVAKVKTTGNQEKPQVALLQNGGAVIVWQGGKPGLQQIYARFLGANGAFLAKTDLRVSTHTKNSQSYPQVATLTDGSVVIVWSSDGQDGSMLGVFARQFSAAGKPLGLEFQVNQTSLYNQRTPALAALANGNFVVAWISELQRSGGSVGSVDVYARIFNGLGAAVTGEFPVNTSIINICANPSLAASPQGGFAVAWSQNDNAVVPTAPIPSAYNSSGITIPSTAIASTSPSTNGWDVFAAFYDATGSNTTAPFRMNQYTYGDQFGPKISALGSNYMAVWTSLSQPDPNTGVVDHSEGVFGQFITAGGVLASANDLHVNTTTLGRQVQPVVVSDGASRFLVVWSSLVTAPIFNFDLFAQQYSQSGGQ